MTQRLWKLEKTVHMDLSGTTYLMQDVQVLGSMQILISIKASYSGGSNATYIYSSALDFDLYYYAAMFEGRILF